MGSRMSPMLLRLALKKYLQFLLEEFDFRLQSVLGGLGGQRLLVLDGQLPAEGFVVQPQLLLQVLQTAHVSMLVTSAVYQTSDFNGLMTLMRGANF